MATEELKIVLTAENKKLLKSLTQSQKGLKTFTKKIDGLSKQLDSFGNKAALAFAGMTAGLGVFLNTAGNFEQWRIAFETMLGSVEKADTLLRDIEQFAKKTPFELPEVVENAKKLLAYNIEAEKLLPTLEALGNISAGVGREKLPFLTLAFGQVRAAGKLTGQELRQFTEAGVPLM